MLGLHASILCHRTKILVLHSGFRHNNALQEINMQGNEDTQALSLMVSRNLETLSGHSNSVLKFELFYAVILLSIVIHVDSVLFLILCLSFVFLAKFSALNFHAMSITFTHCLLLQFFFLTLTDVHFAMSIFCSVMLVSLCVSICLYSRLTRIIWKIRPWA